MTGALMHALKTQGLATEVPKAHAAEAEVAA